MGVTSGNEPLCCYELARDQDIATIQNMINTEHLSKSFDGKLAVNDLSLCVDPGEILGLLGPNGAGKSTTVKILSGMLQPDRGRALVAGFDVVEQPLEVKKRIGVVPESGALYTSLSAAEYLEMVAALHHLPPDVARQRTDELLHQFGLAADQDKWMTGYSKGMKRKVLLISALLHNPEILFLDEPLDGLDPNAARVFKVLLKELASQGKTILFCSHILEVVERICTRIVIIHQGRQIIEGTAAGITAKTGTQTLEEAFCQLTGMRDVGKTTTEILETLEQV